MKLKFVFVYLILFVLAVQAQALTAYEALERDLQPQIKALKKDVQLFHYFSAPSDGTPDSKKIHPIFNTKTSRDEWINYLMAVRGGAFWDFNNHNTDLTNAGPGMYFALDPDSSKEFGESVVQLNVKEGMKMLSVFRAIPLKKDTINLLLKENIIDRNAIAASSTTLSLINGFTRIALKNMVREENVEFRKLVTELFIRNQIQFVEYEYKSHLAGFCKIANQSALVFIGSQPTLVTDPSVAASSEVLATVDPAFQNTLFMSSYEVADYTQDEMKLIDLYSRFKNILAQIRIKGVIAAKKLIHNALSEDEINELANKSYQCVRRY